MQPAVAPDGAVSGATTDSGPDSLELGAVAASTALAGSGGTVERGPAERETIVSAEGKRALRVIRGGVILIHCVLLNVLLCRRAACLLYTSPSPRDLSTSRMPSSA